MRIGFNRIVKFGPSVGPKDLEAMRYVSENTTIPIPRVFAGWSIRKAIIVELKIVVPVVASHPV